MGEGGNSISPWGEIGCPWGLECGMMKYVFEDVLSFVFNTFSSWGALFRSSRIGGNKANFPLTSRLCGAYFPLFEYDEIGTRNNPAIWALKDIKIIDFEKRPFTLQAFAKNSFFALFCKDEISIFCCASPLIDSISKI